jgi:hypothetical protein
MKRRLIPLSLAIAALALGGCMTLDEDGTSPERRPGSVTVEQDRWAAPNTDWRATPAPSDEPDYWRGLGLEILDARLEGSIGHVVALNGSATEATGVADSYWSTLSVTVDKAGMNTGAGMIILDVQGDIRTLSAGRHRLGAFLPRDSDSWEAAPAPQPMYIIGCAGDNPGEWTFDQPAEDAEIVVDDRDPDVLRITFTASFGSASIYDWETGATHATGPSTVAGTVHIAR